MTERTLVWFRGKELRLSDHRPLVSAIERGEVVCCFVVDPHFFARDRAAAMPHRMQFLLESLSDLEREISKRGSTLVVRRGRSVAVIPELARATRATRVVAQRWVEPFGRQRDAKIAAALRVPFELFEGETLAPPNAVLSGEGRPFAVFSAFARAWRRNVEVGMGLPAPTRIPKLPADAHVPSDTVPTLSELGIARNERLPVGGEAAARDRLGHFLEHGVVSYASARDRVDLQGTSRLSQDLKFGTLSVRSVWQAVDQVSRRAANGAVKFQDELLWREFAHTLLWNRPRLLQEPFDPRFDSFPWMPASGPLWDAWVEGRTGYPMVDAAARELLTTGFVHNRARMIAASFLTKHLRMDYRAGEAHYLRYLVDGDWAQNNMGWQWSAGCGCDAQPYFRVFNPMLQGAKFDPNGDYVRRYVPELSRLPAKWIHQPWAAPEAVMTAAGVTLGETYPRPCVDHAAARAQYLAAAGTLKR